MNNSPRIIYGGFGALILLLLVCPAFVTNEYYLHILIMTFLNILIASSLRLVMTMGLVSFAHAVFVAIGGYTSALAVMRLEMNSWLGLLFAVFTSIVISVFFGFVLLRLKGTYFLIASFAFGEIVLLIFTRFTFPFGGAAGLVDIPPPDPITFPGLFSIVFTLGSKVSFYYLALALMLLLLFMAYRVDKGRLGAIWSSIRMADRLAESVGINTMIYKVAAFTIGCAMAAVAGAFQAHYYSHINPSGFNIFVLVNYLIYVVVGGTKGFCGPIIGAVFMTFLAELLSFSQKLADTQVIIYGIILILVIIFLPEGIISLPGKLSSWHRRLGLTEGSLDSSREREATNRGHSV
jgi:branched-chain amino acid transport system permease protein